MIDYKAVFISLALLHTLLCMDAAQGQDDMSSKYKTVEFVFNVPINTPPGSSIYLTGDMPGYCYWRTDCIKLNYLGDRSYGVTLQLPAILKFVEFKVTRGEFANEASNIQGAPLPNFYLPLGEGRTFFRYNVINWVDQYPLGIEGHLRYHANFPSPELGNGRTVAVWVPESYFYKRQADKRYPVIYAHDGQNMFDPARSYLGIDWGMDETMTKLINEELIDEAIVVAVDCSQDRDREYYYKEKGERYAQFLINTLKPFIDANYRTLTDREHTYTIGSSMGALISFYLLWAHPETFSRAAGLAFPPSINNNEFLEVLDKYPRPKESIKVYLDHGMQDMDAGFKDATEKFYAKLMNLGYVPEKDIVYKVFQYSGHNESDWAARLDIPLKFLLNN